MTRTHTPRVADLTLPALTDKLARILKQRRDLYDLSVRKNRMTEDDAGEAMAELAEIDRLWRLWCTHAEELRARWPEIAAARKDRLGREADSALARARKVVGGAERMARGGDVSSHPAVAEVARTFPDARMTDVGPIVEPGATEA